MSRNLLQVTFRLHPSFQTPVRVLDRQPYEVQETGWGEFEAMAEVHTHAQRGVWLRFCARFDLNSWSMAGGAKLSGWLT